MLDTAIQKQDTTATTWIFGKGLIKDGSYHRLQLFGGLFLADTISGEEAKKHNVEETQIVTLERGIKTTKFDEQSTALSVSPGDEFQVKWDAATWQFTVYVNGTSAGTLTDNSHTVDLTTAYAGVM